MAGVQPTGFLAKRKTTKKDAWFGTFSPILDKEQGGDLFALLAYRAIQTLSKTRASRATHSILSEVR